MTIKNDKIEYCNEFFYGTENDNPSTKNISIVIPCYNEEKTIGSVLEKIPVLPHCEVIVVDDGSKDSSREIVRAQFPDVKLICNKHNMGYGKTLLEGIKNASGDIIIHLDSDGQHEPRDIPLMIKPILDEKADITVGSRYLGRYYYALPITTRVGESLIELILRVIFGITVRANQGGFRAFRRDVLADVFNDIKYEGFTFATETIIRAKLSHHKICEVPIKVYDRKHGHSRIKLVKLMVSQFECTLFYSIVKLLGKAWMIKISRFIRATKIRTILDFLQK